jgi:hypothetical protein
MNNFVFVYLIFLNFFCFIKCSENSVYDLDYFIYFNRDKFIFTCSNKEEKKWVVENENSCGINLNKNGIYKVTLHLNNFSNIPSITNSNFENDYSNRKNASLKYSFDIKIGENKIMTNDDYINKHIELIQFFLKLEDGNILYSTNSKCKLNVSNFTECEFLPVSNNTTRIDLIFNKESYDDYNVIFLEKKVKPNPIVCKPSCVNGICHSSSCYCKNGYMGDNCSICKIVYI